VIQPVLCRVWQRLSVQRMPSYLTTMEDYFEKLEREAGDAEARTIERLLGGSDQRLVVPLPCPFCGSIPRAYVGNCGAPYPGGYFEIACVNDACHVAPCFSEKRRTDLIGMTHDEAEAHLWPEMIAKWNLRHA